MVLENYEEIAGFNLEGYYISSSGGLSLMEFIPSKGNITSMNEREDYLGVLFVIDNIDKKIFVFQDDSIKTKKAVKSIKSEKKEAKLTDLTSAVFANELEYDISAYSVKRALDYIEVFRQYLKYQINEYPLYKQHYFLPEYEDEETSADKEIGAPEVASNLKACANCGWLISGELTICPKCRRSPREKFEGK